MYGLFENKDWEKDSKYAKTLTTNDESKYVKQKL
jgi:hypothetical protein